MLQDPNCLVVFNSFGQNPGLNSVYFTCVLWWLSSVGGVLSLQEWGTLLSSRKNSVLREMSPQVNGAPACQV